MKLIQLEKDFNIKVSSMINTYINPEYAYIPMPFGYNLKVKLKEYVYKEQVLLKNDYNKPIISSISGYVIGTKECLDANGKMQKCMVIENDFKENIKRRTGSKRIINNLTLEQIIETLEKKGIVSFSEPYEMLFKTLKKKKKIKTIILNIVEDEPYIISESFVLRQYISEILEMLDALNEIITPVNCYIVIKNNDSENINNLKNLLGTYPKIKLKIIPDLYPIGNSNILVEYLLNKDWVAEEVLVLNASDIYAIYNIIKRNRYLTEKIITISGNGVKNPQVLNVKIGSLIAPIIKENIELIENVNIEYIANGLMRGIKIDINKLIVTKELVGIIINIQDNSQESPCISCGSCFDICPVNINPKYIMDNLPNKKVMKKCKKEKCLSCGLCSYICPAKINLNKYLRGEKNE